MNCVTTPCSGIATVQPPSTRRLAGCTWMLTALGLVCLGAAAVVSVHSDRETKKEKSEPPRPTAAVGNRECFFSSNDRRHHMTDVTPLPPCLPGCCRTRPSRLHDGEIDQKYNTKRRNRQDLNALTANLLKSREQRSVDLCHPRLAVVSSGSNSNSNSSGRQQQQVNQPLPNQSGAASPPPPPPPPPPLAPPATRPAEAPVVLDRRRQTVAGTGRVSAVAGGGDGGDATLARQQLRSAGSPGGMPPELSAGGSFFDPTPDALR